MAELMFAELWAAFSDFQTFNLRQSAFLSWTHTSKKKKESVSPRVFFLKFTGFRHKKLDSEAQVMGRPSWTEDNSSMTKLKMGLNLHLVQIYLPQQLSLLLIVNRDKPVE